MQLVWIKSKSQIPAEKIPQFLDLQHLGMLEKNKNLFWQNNFLKMEIVDKMF